MLIAINFTSLEKNLQALILNKIDEMCELSLLFGGSIKDE